MLSLCSHEREIWPRSLYDSKLAGEEPFVILQSITTPSAQRKHSIAMGRRHIMRNPGDPHPHVSEDEVPHRQRRASSQSS